MRSNHSFEMFKVHVLSLNGVISGHVLGYNFLTTKSLTRTLRVVSAGILASLQILYRTNVFEESLFGAPRAWPRNFIAVESAVKVWNLQGPGSWVRRQIGTLLSVSSIAELLSIVCTGLLSALRKDLGNLFLQLFTLRRLTAFYRTDL